MNAENSDVICDMVQTIYYYFIIIYYYFTIFRRDRSDRGGGRVLIAIKTASFKAVKEFIPEWEAELQELKIIFAKITMLAG